MRGLELVTRPHSNQWWLPNRLGQMILVEQGCIQVKKGADRGYGPEQHLHGQCFNKNMYHHVQKGLNRFEQVSTYLNKFKQV